MIINNISAKISEINKQVIFPGKELDTAIANDLAEIYFTLEKYRNVIDKFLESDIHNRDAMEESLVDIETTLKHIESHIKNAHSLFEQMKTYYCWK